MASLMMRRATCRAALRAPTRCRRPGALYGRALSSAKDRSAQEIVLRRPRLEDVVLVRHGESEGNVAFNRSMAGDHSLYTGPFLERHSSFWRLTDRGRAQALTTGDWMRDNLGSSFKFDGHFTSEYLRAMETASLLQLPSARWKPEVMLRERDWGEYDLASQHERRVAFHHYEARRRRESLFWAPPGGESLAQVVQRVDSVLLFVNRRYNGGRVAFVCHGELMWAFRLRFERLTQLRYREMQADPQVNERIHNCQVVHYTRRDPFTGELHPDFRFMRSVCPWDLDLSDNEWRPVDRSGGLGDDEMMRSVERYPRMYNDEEGVYPDGVPIPSMAGHPEQGLACTGEAGIVGSTGARVGGDETNSRSNNDASAAAAAFVAGSSTPPPRRVLLLTKTARWRLLSTSAGADLPQHDAMRLACEAHENAVESVGEALREAGVEMRTRDAREEAAPADFEWADACLALGGDGTTLRAANAAPRGMLLVGVNTDPQRSVGKLCAVTIGPSAPQDDAAGFVSALLSGSVREKRLPRLRVAIQGAESAGEDAPASRVLHAINECFIGEADPSRPLDVELSIDGGPWALWRSSGAIVSTQLGSGAWMRNAFALRKPQVAAVLRAAKLHLPDDKHSPGPAELAAITEKANASLLAHPDQHALQFLVREAAARAASTVNGAGGGAGGGGGEASLSHCAHGFGRRVRVRPSGWHVVLSIDGLPPTVLPSGSEVELAVDPSQEGWLRTVEPL